MRSRDHRSLLSVQKPTEAFVSVASGLILSLIIYSSSHANIVEVQGSGEYGFGPNISEQLACDLATQEMVRQSARSRFGERIEFDETQLCSSEIFKRSGVACNLDQRMFFSVDENLSVLEIRLQEAKLRYPQESKSYSCRVEGTVKFEYFESKIDKKWVTNLAVDREALKRGLGLKFNGNSSREGFHYLFEDLGSRGYFLLYPNKLDIERRIVGPFKVPTDNARRSYRLQYETDKQEEDQHHARFTLISSKEKIGMEIVGVGVITREQLANVKESLKSGEWTEKKVVF